MIGIIGAMASEVTLLLEHMETPVKTRVGMTDYYTGTLCGQPVAVAECGIGKVCAAMCAQAMFDRFAVSCLINTGVAGGLHPSLNVGDLVIAVDAVQHDFDLSPYGYARGFLPAFGGDGKSPTRFQADEGLNDRFAKAADAVMAGSDQKYIYGTVVSGDIFVDDGALKKQLVAAFNAAAVEMEGAAIAAVAAANGIPFAVIRAISDLAEEEAHVSFELFEKEAARLSAEILMRMLEDF